MNRKIEGVGIQEITDSQEDFFSVGASTLFISALVTIMQKDSKLEVDGAITATTLTTTAATIALHISRRIIASSSLTVSDDIATNAKEHGSSQSESLKFEVITIVQESIRIVKQLKEWYRSHSTFLQEGLEEVVNILERCFKIWTSSDASVEVILTEYKVWWPWFSLFLDPRNLHLSERSIQKHIGKLFDKETSQKLDAHYRLVCCALFFGYRDDLFWSKLPSYRVVDGSETVGLDKAFLTLIEAVINDKAHHGHGIAFSMLKRFIDQSNNSQLMLESILSNLLAMLNEDDAISSAAIGFLADCFSSYPDMSNEIIHHVMKRMGSRDIVQKKNAMHLLEKIFRSNYGGFLTGQTLEIRDALREQLFDRMTDEQITLRNIASRLLSYYDPLDTFSRISKRLISPDAITRSSAEAALISMLNEHNRNAEGVLSLLDLLRSLSKATHSANAKLLPLPSNPGEIHSIRAAISNQDDGQATQKQIERLFDLIKKWTQLIPDQLWSDLVKPLLRKSYSFPKDTILVRFWNTVSEGIGRNPLSVDMLLSELTKILISQPRLTQEMLDSNSEESSLEMQTILFLRLHPLLILKTLPLHCFEQITLKETGQFPTLLFCLATPLKAELQDPESVEGNDVDDYIRSFASQMYERCNGDLEFPQIRTMALEILARIPESIFVISNKLNGLCEATSNDYLNIKHWIFGYCQWFIQTFNDQRRQATFGQQEIKIIQQVVSTSFSKLLSWKSADENLYKLQLGCIDTLSLMLVLCGTEVLKHPSPIVEIEDECVDIKESIFEFTLNFVLLNLSSFEDSNEQDYTQTQISTCMANVIVMTIKRLSNQPLGGTKQAVNIDFEKQILKAFGDRTIPTLMNTVHVAIEHSEFATSGAACFQALFHYSYLIPEYINHEKLIDLSIKGIFSTNSQLCVGSLKLLMSLLAASQGTSYTLSPVTLNQLRQGISALHRSIDEQAPNAQELYVLIDKLENILDNRNE
ncbi:hypothetical protein K7432_004541 [Basidiobolus ranarum]